jgi:tellurite resistance protein
MSGISSPVAASSDRPAGRLPRIGPHLFSMAFGLAGLAAAWQVAAKLLSIPLAVPNALFILAAAVWAVLVAGYLAQGPARVLGDWRDGSVSPFIPLAVITPMILAVALSRFAFSAGQVLVVVFLALTVLLGGWLTGEWIYTGVPQDRVHPGYYLPAVAGGFVGAYCVALVHLHAIAEAAFGIGILSWLMLGALVLNRLIIRPTLPPRLVPTLAVEMAPPMVAGLAWFGVAGSKIDFVAAAFGGYAVLMVLVQLRLIPLYVRLKFTAGFWAFTFTSAAAATDALLWLAATRPSGTTAYAAVVLGLVTLLIGGIAVRSVIAMARGQFFPSQTPVPAPAAAAAEGARSRR